MKTLSFHELAVGRGRNVLLKLDTKLDGAALQPGVHLIVAPNGYGKTTLLQTLAGVLPPVSGQMNWGESWIRHGEDVLYVSEYLAFPKFIYPGEWIEFMSGRKFEGELKAELKPWIDGFSLEPKLKSYLGRMSQGERRKTTWLAAHASRRPVLLLDEPLDGLDLLAIGAARGLVSKWREEGRVVCIVAHQVGELIDLANEVWLMGDGKLRPWTSAIPKSQPAQKLSAAEFRAQVLEYYRATKPALSASRS